MMQRTIESGAGRVPLTGAQSIEVNVTIEFDVNAEATKVTQRRARTAHLIIRGASPGNVRVDLSREQVAQLIEALQVADRQLDPAADIIRDVDLDDEEGR